MGGGLREGKNSPNLTVLMCPVVIYPSIHRSMPGYVRSLEFVRALE